MFKESYIILKKARVLKPLVTNAPSSVILAKAGIQPDSGSTNLAFIWNSLSGRIVSNLKHTVRSVSEFAATLPSVIASSAKQSLFPSREIATPATEVGTRDDKQNVIASVSEAISIVADRVTQNFKHVVSSVGDLFKIYSAPPSPAVPDIAAPPTSRNDEQIPPVI